MTTKPRPLVEALYMFGSIALLAACLPLTLLIAYSGLALLFKWTVNDDTAYAAMRNALVLTEVLLAVGFPLMIAAWAVSRQPPAKTPVGDTQTTQIQVPPTE